MSCQTQRNEEGELIAFFCGPDKAKDHRCDLEGPSAEIPGSNGCGWTSTCSICGRHAFNEWDIWT